MLGLVMRIRHALVLLEVGRSSHVTTAVWLVRIDLVASGTAHPTQDITDLLLVSLLSPTI